MRVRVFTDLRFTSHPRQTGVGKHIYQMVDGLRRVPDNAVEVMVMRDQVDDHRKGSLSHLPSCQVPLPWKAAEALWTLTGYPQADRWCGKADWVYCPKNDFIPVKNAKLAVTVHGAHELDPQFPQSSSVTARINQIRRRLSYQRMLSRADRVLTVSQFLQHQMMEWFDVPEEKFRVVGNGVEPDFYAAAELPHGLSGQSKDRPYVLCVGGLNELDGGNRIVKVAEILRQKDPDLRVLIAGGDHEPIQLDAVASSPNIELLGYTHSSQLALLMRDAVALLYPTRYETFGIAAAEAMAVGTPVVTCRSTAIPEIVGEAGLYAEEDDPHEMAELLLSLLNDSKIRNTYSRLGITLAQKYTWNSCVEKLIAALDNE